MPKPIERDLPETEVRPDPLVEKRTRRAFAPEYKLRIIAEADQYRHGEIGALLRRENLYSNQLQNWRRQLAEGGEQALSKSAPGLKPKFTAEQREVEKLLRENARLTRKLEIANGCLELQKKTWPRSIRSRMGTTTHGAERGARRAHCVGERL